MVKITPHPFKNLGGIERPVDKRDFNMLAGSTPEVAPIPPVYMQENAWAAPIYYQGQQPACGAHAGSWLATLLNSYSGTMPKYSPRFTWVDIKSFDGYAIKDGTDMRSVFTSLKNTGVDDYEPLENDASLSLTVYASPVAVTQAMKDAASPNKTSNYAFAWSPTFDQLKQLIYQNKGVVLLLQVGHEMWSKADGTSSWAEKDVLPLRVPKGATEGHFVVAHSYDENYIYFANSWSTSWGRKGHGYFGKDYMPFVSETGTTTTIAQWVKDNLLKQITIYQMIVSILQKLLKLKNG